MDVRLVFEIQRLYPQIYLACHVEHIRAASTAWRLSSHDASILSHLDLTDGMRPRELGSHLNIVPSTLSASIKRLVGLGYITSTQVPSDKRKREIKLTVSGAEAMASASVLDGERVKELLEKLTPDEREDAMNGLLLLARAAREIKERK